MKRHDKWGYYKARIVHNDSQRLTNTYAIKLGYPEQGSYIHIVEQLNKSTMTKEELNKEIIDILDNVMYWETCPENYKARIEAIIKQLK